MFSGRDGWMWGECHGMAVRVVRDGSCWPGSAGCGAALEGWIGLKLLRQQGRLLLRIEALEKRLDSAPTRPLLVKSKQLSQFSGCRSRGGSGFRLPDLKGTGERWQIFGGRVSR
jgi:hypothetical protein